MRTIRRRSLLVWTLGALIVTFALTTAAQTSSPLNGTWKFNAAKSKYNPTSLTPRSNTITYTITGDTIKGVTDGVDAQGRATHTEYTAKLDGKTYPGKFMLDGKPNPDQDGVMWKKIDNNTYETTAMLKGKGLLTSHIVVAPDGRSRTTTQTGKNAQGQTINNTVVYDRVSAT
jgi:hypothetical protein